MRTPRNNRILPALLVASLVAFGIAGTVGARPGNAQEQRVTDQAPDPRQLLRRMLAAETNRPIQGHEVTFIAGGRQSEQIVKRDPQQGMRTEFLKPSRDILVDNYRRSWNLSPRAGRMVERGSRMGPLRDAVAGVIAAIERGELLADYDGRDMVAGRPTHIVRVSPPAGISGPSRRFWIDRATGLRLKNEEIAPEGHVLASSYYLTVNVAPTFRPSDFTRPKPPPGVRVQVEERDTFAGIPDAQKTVGFPVRKPGFLPPGFVLQGVSVTNFRGSKVVVQRYANGLNLVTLFQTDAVLPPAALERLGAPPPDGRAPARGPRVHSWRENGISYALIGPLPLQQMRRIASSVR